MMMMMMMMMGSPTWPLDPLLLSVNCDSSRHELLFET